MLRIFTVDLFGVSLKKRWMILKSCVKQDDKLSTIGDINEV